MRSTLLFYNMNTPVCNHATTSIQEILSQMQPRERPREKTFQCETQTLVNNFGCLRRDYAINILKNWKKKRAATDKVKRKLALREIMTELDDRAEKFGMHAGNSKALAFPILDRDGKAQPDRERWESNRKQIERTIGHDVRPALPSMVQGAPVKYAL